LTKRPIIKDGEKSFGKKDGAKKNFIKALIFAILMKWVHSGKEALQLEIVFLLD
jgi:hypothetical protein